MIKLRFNFFQGDLRASAKHLNQAGFTLLEVMIVVAIIAILATIAMPSQTGRVNQQKIVETLELVERYKLNIDLIYQATGQFPEDNDAAGIPEANSIIGNYLQEMEVEDGAMHLTLGNKLTQLVGQIITVQPVYVQDSPGSPVSWICAFDQVPDGMVAAGNNRTDVARSNLPGRCR